ncbi:MAG: TRAP transporter small permease [Pararhodobacter sp.]
MTADRVARGLDLLLAQAVGLALVVLIGIEAAQVLGRYALGTGVSWARDVATLLLMTVGWLGAPLLWLRRAHIAVDLWPRWRARDWPLDVLMLVCGPALVVISLRAMDGYRMIDLPALGTDATIKVWPMLAGAVLLTLVAALNLLRRDRP